MCIRDRGITANMFVNIAILGYMLLKEESAKIFIALSAIFMFVFLINEHLIANFASFMLLGFNGVRDAVDNFTLANILRQWIVVFFGNWIGGGIFIGLDVYKRQVQCELLGESLQSTQFLL